MPPLQPWALALSSEWTAPVAIFLLAGLVKGVLGLGLPTVAMALLALWMPPLEAAALLVVPSLVTNLWQLAPKATLAPLAWRLVPLLLAVLVGTWIGAWWWGPPAGAEAMICLGAALLAYALWGWRGRALALSPLSERWWGPVVGLSTGLLTAVSGVFVVPAVPYLQALGLQRDGLVQAMGLSFTVSTVALAAGLHANGHLAADSVAGSLAMLVPALAGMALGQRMRYAIPQALFRRIFLLALALLGLHMLVQGIGAAALP